jgi:serine protease Do
VVDLSLDAVTYGRRIRRPLRWRVGGNVLGLGSLCQRYNIADEASGVVVLNVDVKSNAAGKGLKAGDIIVEVDQKAVATPADVEKRIAAAKANGYTVITFLIYRQGDFQWVAIRTDQG